MKNTISHPTLSYEVSQMVQEGKLLEAYARLPEANTVPHAWHKWGHSMSMIKAHLEELADLTSSLREELEQDWSQGEVQAFLAGAWQGFRASLVKLEDQTLMQIYAPKR